MVGNPVHSVGDPLSDNLLYVPGSTGHGIGGTSSTALLNRLDAGAPLLDMDPNDFLPIDEALQLLGASQLLNVYDGDESDQTINGTNDNDTLNGGSGNDYVNGGGGLDTVVIDATRDAVSDVRRDGADNRFKVYTADGTDTVVNVERLQFDNGRMALDMFGGPDSDNGRAGHIFRSYQTVLGRKPDIAGFTNWVERYDAQGTWDDPYDVLKSFIKSPEFQNKFQQRYGESFNYNAAEDREQFVEMLYRVGLGRAPDSAGLNSWVNALNSGTSMEQVAFGISNSQEMKNKMYNSVKDGVPLDVRLSFDGDVGGLVTARAAFATGGAEVDGDQSVTETTTSWDDVSIETIVMQYSAGFHSVIAGTDETDDRLTGTRKADLIVGGYGDDELSGRKGKDHLIGGHGDDTLNGGQGKDRIEGGLGDDELTGGNGKDVFVFTAADFSKDRDVITDFQDGKDLIEFDTLAFDDLTITDSDAGAVVAYNDGETITLTGITADQLTADDFLFT